MWGAPLCSETLEKQPKYVPAGHFSICFLEIKENVWEKFFFKSDKKMHQYGFGGIKNYGYIFKISNH